MEYIKDDEDERIAIDPKNRMILIFEPASNKVLFRLHTQLVTPNHWLVTQRMNMPKHALERHAAAVRQLSNGTNGDDLYIHIATVGNTIQTVNSPMYDTYISTPGNTAKLGSSHTQQHTDSTKRSVPGWERTFNALVSTPLSQHFIHYACQA